MKCRSVQQFSWLCQSLPDLRRLFTMPTCQKCPVDQFSDRDRTSRARVQNIYHSGGTTKSRQGPPRSGPVKQKQMLGERLFPLNQNMHCSLAGKIDMLLESLQSLSASSWMKPWQCCRFTTDDELLIWCSKCLISH